MAKITYHTHDSKTHTIEVQNGLTVMEGAVQNDVPGIVLGLGEKLLGLTSQIFLTSSFQFDKTDNLP